jgi:hypothetical protein
MTITAPVGLAEMKQRTRATWAAGDFAATARLTLWQVGERRRLIMLRGVLESSGAWPGLRKRPEELYDRHEPGEFLVVQGRKS